MKGSPSWPQGVPGVWKVDLLRWLGSVTGIKSFIETGTCHGYTSWSLRNNFDVIHTVELHPELFGQSQKRLSEINHIHLWAGSSKWTLKYMIESIGFNKPILFWLDAHVSGPQTADDGDPLPGELKTIISLCPKALIVIDDMKDAELNHVIDAGVNLDGWHREYRTGEIIMYKEGEYQIPPFEDGEYVANPDNW